MPPPAPQTDATDLGEVVTDKLIEAFPQILDVGYTREMELELDKVCDIFTQINNRSTSFSTATVSTLQTTAGRMIFAKLEGEVRAA